MVPGSGQLAARVLSRYGRDTRGKVDEEVHAEVDTESEGDTQSELLIKTRI